MEIWKDIKGYESLYQVSNLGRVKSLHVKMKQYNEEGIKKPRANPPSYYYQVWLEHNGKGELRRVSRLVAEAFIPNPLNLPQVNHKDMNRQNDCVDNLEWCTQSQNMRHRKLHKQLTT